MNESKLIGKKIIIYTPELNFKTGGVIVLHNLAKDLIELGCNAMLFVIGEKKYENIFCNSFASLSDVDENAIVVYPEIVEGNPLNAKHVVRWLLCDIGVHCAKDVYKTWGDNDLLFHFSTFNDKYDPHSIDLLYTIWLDPAVRNKDLTREGSCYLFKKAPSFHEKLQFIHPKDAIMIDNCSNEEIIEIFNTKEFFYCYDPYSFYDIIAALCGCIPIVYPIEGVSKLDWLKTKATFQPYLDKNDNVSGIAYGLDDIQYARKTLGNVRKEQEEVIGYGEKTVVNFTNKIDTYFFKKREDYKFKTVGEAVKFFRWNLKNNTDDDILLRQKDRKIKNLYQEIQQKEQVIQQKDYEIGQRTMELYEIRNSLRWKIPNYFYKICKKNKK